MRSLSVTELTMMNGPYGDKESSIAMRCKRLNGFLGRGLKPTATIVTSQSEAAHEARRLG